MGAELRGQWIDAITRATDAEGVTLAVVPLRVLAEPDGVLDQLERRGLTSPARPGAERTHEEARA